MQAAISKYGIFQWSRVSSLLPRKTPAQCKEHYLNHMNPSLNKQEWTHREDIELISLVESMPNQWASIGSVLQRNAQNCHERYQLLLEKGIDNVVNIKPSEESKEVSEFDHEMLAEAQARLAINQGKKPQRKARERAQAQAKQLADIQRMREMAMLGNKMKLKKKSKINGIDYNAEIPFEHRPPKGVYDTEEEDLLAEKDKIQWEKNIKGVGILDANLFTGAKYQMGGSKGKRKSKENDTPVKRAKISVENMDVEAEKELKLRPKLEFVKQLSGNNSEQNKIEDSTKKLKSLRRSIKEMFSTLAPIEDDYDTVPIIDLEIPVIPADEENEGPASTFEMVPQRLLIPQAVKLGLPIPATIQFGNNDKTMDTINEELQKLISDIPNDNDTHEYPLKAYQSVMARIDEEMKLYTSASALAIKDVKFDDSKLYEIIIKCTNESTEIENKISAYLRDNQAEMPYLRLAELQHLRDTIWVQKQILKVEKKNFKLRESNLNNNITSI